MSGKSSTIFLGDLARAICDLGLSDAAAVKLAAQMLGFSVEISAEKEPPQSKPLRTGKTSAPGLDNEASVEPVVDDFEGEVIPATAAKDWQAIPIEVNRTTGQKETWIPEVEPLPPQEDGPLVTPPLIPLFMPQWTRGILSAALSTWADEGLLDIDGVTEILARGENVARLPTVPSLTLGRGVQLLLDKSQAMMPFVRDQAWLVNEIRNVVGADKVKVRRFIGSPIRGAGVGARPWPAYEPPPPGIPVVILSDLGIRQPMLAADWADEEEWANFADLVSRANCPLLALVPYKASRWPRSLTRLITIVPWDRITTAASVARSRKASSGVQLI